MGNTNQDLINDAEAALAKATGGAISLGNVNFGNLIPREQVIGMIDLTIDSSQLLKSITTRTVQQKKGVITIYDLEGYVLEHVGELDATPVESRPDTTRADYVTEKHRANIVFSYEELREAKAAGMANFESFVAQSFTKQLGNNVASICINGVKGLAPTTRQNRALKGVNGLDVQTAASNIYAANGKAFGKGVFEAMRFRMPVKYRNQPGFRWLCNPSVEYHWQHALTPIATQLGDQAITRATVPPPLSIPFLSTPHVYDDQGPTAIAPTSVANNTTYLQFVLTTLVTAGNPATAAAGVGRRFKVTHVASGVSEICTGFVDTTLRINTAGLLGQTGTPSTTASHYVVTSADETDIYYLDPMFNCYLVWCEEWRVDRRYDEKIDGIRYTIHMEFDFLVPVPGAIVKYTGIAVPPIESWT